MRLVLKSDRSTKSTQLKWVVWKKISSKNCLQEEMSGRQLWPPKTGKARQYFYLSMEYYFDFLINFKIKGWILSIVTIIFNEFRNKSIFLIRPDFSDFYSEIRYKFKIYLKKSRASRLKGRKNVLDRVLSFR